MTIRPFTLAALGVALTACGGGDDIDVTQDKVAQAASEVVSQIEGAPEGLEEEVGGLVRALIGGDEAIETVSSASLREMMPKTLLGMERVSLSASKNGFGGLKVSTADAEYEGDNASEKLVLSISDLGSIQGMAKMGLDWLESEMYEETRDGFERTIEYKGHRGFEEFSKAGGTTRGNRKIIIDGRFVLDVTGVNVPFETIEEVFEGLPVEQFEEMSKG
ncbi:MAG: hypothetical protein AB8G16_02815 [Gammaproteobacteria bacterium]